MGQARGAACQFGDEVLQPEPISFLNTGLPLILLGALAVALPYVLVPRATRKHWEVAVAIWAAAGFLLLAGAFVFAAIYGWQGKPIGAAFAEAPLATLWFLLGVSGYAVVAWGPILLLVWFGLAQRVEKRKGEDGMRGGSRR